MPDILMDFIGQQGAAREDKDKIYRKLLPEVGGSNYCFVCNIRGLGAEPNHSGFCPKHELVMKDMYVNTLTKLHRVPWYRRLWHWATHHRPPLPAYQPHYINPRPTRDTGLFDA